MSEIFVVHKYGEGGLQEWRAFDKPEGEERNTTLCVASVHATAGQAIEGKPPYAVSLLQRKGEGVQTFSPFSAFEAEKFANALVAREISKIEGKPVFDLVWNAEEQRYYPAFIDEPVEPPCDTEPERERERERPMTKTATDPETFLSEIERKAYEMEAEQ